MLLRILLGVLLAVAILAGIAAVEARATRRSRSGRTEASLTDTSARGAADADAE